MLYVIINLTQVIMQQINNCVKISIEHNSVESCVRYWWRNIIKYILHIITKRRIKKKVLFFLLKYLWLLTLSARAFSICHTDSRRCQLRKQNERARMFVFPSHNMDGVCSVIIYSVYCTLTNRFMAIDTVFQKMALLFYFVWQKLVFTRFLFGKTELFYFLIEDCDQAID